MSKPNKKRSLRPAKKQIKSKKQKPAQARKIAKIAKKSMKKQVSKKAKIATVAKKVEKITIREKEPAPVIVRKLSPELLAVLSMAQARQWLVELGGENTLEVIRNLPAVPNDEELSKKLKIKVSDVRASLNKLHNEGLVTYIRDKNSETGWYSYAWLLNDEKIRRWVDAKMQSTDMYKPQEGVEFYFCKDCGLDSAVKFEVAAEHSFKCPSCSSPLDFLDEQKLEKFKKPKELG